MRLPYRAGPCRPAPKGRSNGTCCRTPPRWPRTVTCGSAASTSSTWPSSSARRSSSTTRRTCGRVPSGGGGVGRRRGVRDEGVPLQGDGPAGRRRGHVPRRVHRRRAGDGVAAGVPADRLVLHGNNKSDTELADALDAGVGRVVVDSFDEIARLGRLVDDRPGGQERPKVLVRVTPGVEVHTHEFVRTGQEDTKFGFSVASGAAGRAVPRSAAPGRLARRRRRAHRQPGLRRWPLRAGGRGARGVLRAARPAGAVSSAVVSACRMSTARPRRPQAEWATTARPGVRGGRLAPARGSPPSRAGHRRRRRDHLYRLGTVNDSPGSGRTSRRRWDERQPPPGALRQRLRDFLPREVVRPGRVARVVGKHCDPATSSCRRDSGRPGGWATPGDAGHRRLRVLDGLELQQGPAPAVVFVADGGAGRWSAARRSTTCCGWTLTHGRVADPLRAGRSARPGRRRPACVGRWPSP